MYLSAQQHLALAQKKKAGTGSVRLQTRTRYHNGKYSSTDEDLVGIALVWLA